MKYNDRGTIRSASKHQNKMATYDPYSSYERKRKKALKRTLLEFSYIVPDKIWWKALDDDDKESVYSRYLSYMTGLRALQKSDADKKKMLNGFFDNLKALFIPDPQKRREIVLDQILTF